MWRRSSKNTRTRVLSTVVLATAIFVAMPLGPATAVADEDSGVIGAEGVPAPSGAGVVGAETMPGADSTAGSWHVLSLPDVWWCESYRLSYVTRGFQTIGCWQNHGRGTWEFAWLG
jgi:hypothetical protein